VESGKKRGFCPTLAACGCGGGVHPCTRVALDEKRFMLQGRAEGAMEN
jgi:hypothetical protein